jgi:hypothetical protein
MSCLSSFLDSTKTRKLESGAATLLKKVPTLWLLLKQNKLSNEQKSAILVKILDHSSTDISTPAAQKTIHMLLKYKTPVTNDVLYNAGAIGDMNLINQLYSADSNPCVGLAGAAFAGRATSLQFFLTQCDLRQVLFPDFFKEVLVTSVKRNMLTSVRILIAHASMHNDAAEAALRAASEYTQFEIIFALIEAGASDWSSYQLTESQVLELQGSCKVSRHLYVKNKVLYEMWISEWERGLLALLLEYDPHDQKFAFPTVLAQLILQFVNETSQRVIQPNKKI